jgi:hypothetical protein
MNIFYLDEDPELSAKYHCDKHVVKMILEYGQLLSTAHHVIDKDEAIKDLYKPTHINHPSAVWVRECATNYHYVWSLLSYCCDEYTERYYKTHKLERDELLFRLMAPPKYISSVGGTAIKLAMPDEYKCADPVLSYRAYYKNAKRSICKWTSPSTEPEWFNA